MCTISGAIAIRKRPTADSSKDRQVYMAIAIRKRPIADPANIFYRTNYQLIATSK